MGCISLYLDSPAVFVTRARVAVLEGDLFVVATHHANGQKKEEDDASELNMVNPKKREQLERKRRSRNSRQVTVSMARRR